MKPRLFHFLSLLIFTQFEYAAFAERIEKPELSFELPEQWIEIPSDVLGVVQKTIIDEVAERSPTVNLSQWDYGLQDDRAENWMNYPYILIEINSSGHIPDEIFEKLPQVDPTSAGKDIAEALERMADNISLSHMQYDKEKHIVWSTLAMNVKNVGAIKALSAILPTDSGYIQINAYAREEEFSDKKSIFKSFVESVSLKN